MSWVEKVAAVAGRAIPDWLQASELLARAFEIARSAHAGQVRKDGSAYIGHPLTVAETLAEAGFGEDVLAAGLLHDVVEDTDVEQSTIQRDFGDRVAVLVAVMTDDKQVEPYVERKRVLREAVEAAGIDAVAIFAADKLANLRLVRGIYSTEGERISSAFPVPLDERVAIWDEDLEMVTRAAPALPFLRDLRYQLESFEVERTL